MGLGNAYIGTLAELDPRELEAIRALGPHFDPARNKVKWAIRRLADRPVIGWLLYWTIPSLSASDCAYCGRKAKRKTGYVHPLSLRRGYIELCARRECRAALSTWEGTAKARQVRALTDWEKQNPESAARRLIGSIPAQYPSVSRATLRAFIESDMEFATIEESGPGDASTLNGTIKTLGFADQVYAETRSGQAVLKRIRSRTPEDAAV